MLHVNTMALGGQNRDEDFLKWKSCIERYAESAKTYEIHCWTEEVQWIDLALQYGKYRHSEWSFGKIIAGSVTKEFIKMLLDLPKPMDTEVYDKMTPFFSIFFDNGFSSEHYGTELQIVESVRENEKGNEKGIV